MKLLKTKKCIVCGGGQAITWHGDVVAKERYAIGNLRNVKVIAGFCKEHASVEILDENGRMHSFFDIGGYCGLPDM